MFGISLKPRRAPQPVVWRKGRAKRSKQVLNRIKDTGTLRASIDGLRSDTLGRLSDKLSPVLGDGEKLPDFALTLELAVRTVEGALEGLLAADDRLRSVAMLQYRGRQECERLARRELNPGMRKVRKMAEALYGKEAGQDLHGLEGKTLRKPGRVLHQARELIATLEDHRRKVPLPAPDLPATLDAWLVLVKPAYDQLVAALSEMQSRQHQQDYWYVQRHLAFERFDPVYLEALQLLEAIYRIAGHPEKVIRCLRSYVQRRRLVHEARVRRLSRLAQRGRQVRKKVRATAAKVAGWRPWRRRPAA